MFSCPHCRPMPAAHVWRPRSDSYDLVAAQRTTNVDAAHDFISPPVRVDLVYEANVTQPRMASSNPLHGTSAACMDAPPPYSPPASDFRLNPAYLLDEADGPDPVRHHHDMAGPCQGLSDPLPQAVRAAWKTTGTLQGFYGAEFSHALESAGTRLAQLEGTTLRQALEANFRTLGVSACNGTALRALRDVLSLAVSVPIAVGVGMQVAAGTPTVGALGFDSFSDADLPFGSMAASYGLMCAELLKGPLTAGLSYQTISRHHMVDDYLTRTECTLKLADAILNQLGAGGSAGLTALSRTNRGTAMACLGAGEMARHLSTVFTLLNYLIAPVRVGLFAHNELLLTGGQPDKPDWMDPLVGLLRFASSMSDTMRAVLSQVGTQCRHERFSLRMGALLDSAEYLSMRVPAAKRCRHVRSCRDGAQAVAHPLWNLDERRARLARAR